MQSNIMYFQYKRIIFITLPKHKNSRINGRISLSYLTFWWNVCRWVSITYPKGKVLLYYDQYEIPMHSQRIAKFNNLTEIWIFHYYLFTFWRINKFSARSFSTIFVVLVFKVVHHKSWFEISLPSQCIILPFLLHKQLTTMEYIFAAVLLSFVVLRNLCRFLDFVTVLKLFFMNIIHINCVYLNPYN